MKLNVEITLEMDPDHPYIDSLGDYRAAMKLLLEDILYDDDYLQVEDISVKEDK